MPILTKANRERPADEVRRANNLRRLVNQSTRAMIDNVNRGLSLIWDAPDPAAVLAELGTDAAESFDLNNKTIAFLGTVVVGGDYEEDYNKILAKVAAIPPCTVHEDGTVTIDD